MQDFGTKADNSPPPGGQLSAAEFNNLATENETAVLRSGQSLSGASTSQLATSLFLHGVKSSTFQDSGAANSYVLTPASGSLGVMLPSTYSEMNGTIVLFKPANANSGASTLNIGQTTGTLLGAKNIVDQFGSALSAGAISQTYVQLRYDSSIGAGSWVLMPWSSSGRLINIQTFTSSGTYTPTPGTTRVFLRVLAGGGGGGGTPVTNASQSASGGGGSAGSYAEGWYANSTSQSVTVGGGGGVGAGVTGAAGGASAFGGLISCPGGLGGTVGVSVSVFPTVGQLGGQPSAAPTGGNVVSSPSAEGGYGFLYTSTSGVGGAGTSSVFGGGGVHSANAPGNPGSGRGAGGSGACAFASSPAVSGGAGSGGIVIVMEYA